MRWPADVPDPPGGENGSCIVEGEGSGRSRSGTSSDHRLSWLSRMGRAAEGRARVAGKSAGGSCASGHGAACRIWRRGLDQPCLDRSEPARPSASVAARRWSALTTIVTIPSSSMSASATGWTCHGLATYRSVRKICADILPGSAGRGRAAGTASAASPRPRAAGRRPAPRPRRPHPGSGLPARQGRLSGPAAKDRASTTAPAGCAPASPRPAPIPRA